MYYSCGCCCSCGVSASCGCYQSTCSQCISTTTTTTTTISPDCEPCDEFYDCECIIYNDLNNGCYGLKDGDNLCKVLEIIIQNLPQCKPVVPPLACSFTATVTIV
jgi:hypothetical protein